MKSIPTAFRPSLAVVALAAAAAAQGDLTQGQVVIQTGDVFASMDSASVHTVSPIDVGAMDLDGNIFVRLRFTGGSPAVTGVNDRGLFLGRASGDFHLVLRSGAPDPTVGGQLGGLTTTLSTATATGPGSGYRISPTGQILLFGTSMVGTGIVTGGVAGTDNSTALLYGTANNLNVLARRSDFVTTPSNGQTYQFNTSFSTLSQQTSSLIGPSTSFPNGLCTFQATVIGGDVVTTLNNAGWMRGSPGNLDWVIRKGDQVTLGGSNPGTFEIGTLGFNCALNQAGLMFHDETLQRTAGSLVHAGSVVATTANDSCLFFSPIGGLHVLVAREGDEFDPVNNPGALLGAPTMAQGFGANGQCAFQTTFTGAVTTADNQGLFLGAPGAMNLIERKGQQAAGLPTGVVYNALFTSCAYSDYDGGAVAFYATLVDPVNATVTGNDDSAVFLYTVNSGTRLIARENDTLPGYANLPGYIDARLGAANGNSGLTPGTITVNDRGMIQFSALGCQITQDLGAGPVTTNYSTTLCNWDPTTGLHTALITGPGTATTTGGPTNPNPDTLTLNIGTLAAGSLGGSQFPSGDGSNLSVNADGDYFTRINPSGGSAIVRGRIGSMNCGASSIAEATGGVHTMRLDGGVGNAGNLWAVVASASGTRPGFLFSASNGTFTVPLNNDWVTSMSLSSLSFFPGAPWGTTLGFLDSNGRGSATLTVPASTGFIGLDVRHAFAVLDLGFNVLHISAPCGMLLY